MLLPHGLLDTSANSSSTLAYRRAIGLVLDFECLETWRWRDKRMLETYKNGTAQCSI